LLFIIQLCHIVLCVPYSSFKMQMSLPDFQYPTPLIMFYLLSLLIYSSTFFSSLLLKKELPAILLSPLIIVFGLLCLLPLYLISFIILPSEQLQFLFSGIGDDITFYYFPTAILLTSFALFGSLLWQKAISKGIKATKIFFTVTGIIFGIYFVTYTILNISAGLELSKTLKQVKAQGIKMTLEDIIPPPVPDEENAALVYQKAFDLVEELNKEYKDKWEYLPWVYNTRYSFDREGIYYYNNDGKLEELTPEQKKAFSQLLFEDTDSINIFSLIEKSVDFPACRFDIKYEDGPAMLLPHIQKMRQLSRFVAFRTYLLTDEKKYQEAFNSAFVGLKLGESLKDEPFLTHQLVRIALNGIAAASFQPIISISPEEISIKDYQNLIAEIDKKENKLTKGLEAELAFINTFIFKKLLTGNLEELYEGGIFGEPGSTTSKLFLIFYSYLGRPLLKQDCAFYVHYLIESMSLSRLPYYQTKDRLLEWDKKFWRDRWQYKYSISAMVMPALNRCQLNQARDNAQLDGLKIALALKIYKKKNGSYPNNLTAIVPDIISELPLDPFTGENFIYRKEGEGFIVYSVGENETDNNGVYEPKYRLQRRLPFLKGEEYDDIVWKCKE
ncbi:MAG: hypothetical protein KKH49_05390, partial [Candidatus Omnitrophica bacterium]|nr:hypothetical protein [Candidatus Omnitrophota bacterium]